VSLAISGIIDVASITFLSVFISVCAPSCAFAFDSCIPVHEMVLFCCLGYGLLLIGSTVCYLLFEELCCLSQRLTFSQVTMQYALVRLFDFRALLYCGVCLK